MVGENFEICWPQMARNSLKLSTMVGEKYSNTSDHGALYIVLHGLINIKILLARANIWQMFGFKISIGVSWHITKYIDRSLPGKT